MLDKFSEAIRGNLTKNQRAKIVALVTIEVHSRDIVDKLYKINCMDTNSFDWLSQLRAYWEKVGISTVNECFYRNYLPLHQY
jgi:dynein heavy chain